MKLVKDCIINSYIMLICTEKIQMTFSADWAKEREFFS